MDEKKEKKIKASIPEVAFSASLSDLGLPAKTISILEGGGLSNVGDLMVRLKADRDSILALGGIGPRTLEVIDAAVVDYSPTEAAYPKPVASLADQFKAASLDQVKDSSKKAEKKKAEKKGKKKDKKDTKKKKDKKAGAKMKDKKGKDKDKKKKKKKDKKKDKKGKKK